MDEGLNLPDFNQEPLPPVLRSIDDIEQWIEEDYALLFDRELYEREKRLNSVNVPFRLE